MGGQVRVRSDPRRYRLLCSRAVSLRYESKECRQHSSLEGIQHYGDVCDADLNNDGTVNTGDFFGFFRPQFGGTPGPGTTDP